MVFNFGAFDAGVKQSNDEFKSRRAENAALYGDFIKNNPDASVDERATFSENLGGNSNFLKNALPSRDLMEKNVARRQQQLASAATARKQAALQNNIKIAGQLAGVYGNAYISGGEEGALSAVKELAGDVLPEAALPLVQQFGRTKAQEIVNQRMQPKFDNWKLAGASPSDIQAWQATVSEGAQDLLAPWTQQANATVSSLQAAEYQQASADATSVVNSRDETKVNNFVTPANVKALYPHLDAAGVQKVIAETNAKYEGYKTVRAEKISAATKSATASAQSQIAQGEILSVEEAVRIIEEAGRKIDPNYELGADETRALENSLQIRLKQENSRQDMEENQELLKDAQEITGAAQFVAGGDPGKVSEVIEEVQSRAEAFVVEDGPDAKALAGSAVAATEKFSEMYGVPINNAFVWSALSDTALDFAKATGSNDPLKVSDGVMLAAADRAMRNLQGPQGQAYKLALADMGVGSLNDAKEAGIASQFATSYQAALQKVTVEFKDVIEAGVYNPELIKGKIVEDVDTAKSLIATVIQAGEDGQTVLQRAQAVVDTEASAENLPSIVDGVYDQEVALAKHSGDLYETMAMLKDRKRRAEARLLAPEFQTVEMMPKLKDARDAIQTINAQMQEAKTLYNQINQRRTQLGEKGMVAIKGNARANEQNLEAIADMIGPMALRSGSSSSEQIAAAKQMIESSIGENPEVNPHILERIILAMVKVNLELEPELPEDIKVMISRLEQNKAESAPQQGNGQSGTANLTGEMVQGTNFMQPVIDALTSPGGGSTLPDFYNPDQ
jgi:hypothetical protein